MPPGNGWNEWSKHVLLELERLNNCYEKLSAKLDKINNRLTMVQVKTATLGGTVALVVTIVVMIIASFMKK